MNASREYQYLAHIIAQKTGADVFRIVPVKAYPTDHSAHTAQAKLEQSENARPAIKDDFGDLSQYDTIFLGYPIWWGDLPMPVYTFLESHDLSVKRSSSSEPMAAAAWAIRRNTSSPLKKAPMSKTELIAFKPVTSAVPRIKSCPGSVN